MSRFNLLTYSDWLKKGKSAGYTFIGFDKAKTILSDTKKSKHLLKKPEKRKCNRKKNMGYCLLRHDVDADLNAAVKMAQVENKLSIKATYFLMLRSPLYNLMSRASQKNAEEILKLGHDIGLHYDQGFDESRSVSLLSSKRQIAEQSAWIENFLHCKVTAVSFHQPNKTILKTNFSFGPRVNTYDKNLLQVFRYLSDSNRKICFWVPTSKRMILRSESYVFKKWYPENLQILIHPMWWVYSDETTDKVWNRVIKRNFYESQKQLLETEKAYGVERYIKIQKNFE